MLVYELLVFMFGVVMSMIILNLDLPEVKIDTEQIEFQYYYSSCLGKSYGERYSWRSEKLMRIYSKNTFIIEYEDC